MFGNASLKLTIWNYENLLSVLDKEFPNIICDLLPNHVV